MQRQYRLDAAIGMKRYILFLNMPRSMQVAFYQPSVTVCLVVAFPGFVCAIITRTFSLAVRGCRLICSLIHWMVSDKTFTLRLTKRQCGHGRWREEFEELAGETYRRMQIEPTRTNGIEDLMIHQESMGSSRALPSLLPQVYRIWRHLVVFTHISSCL